MTLPIAILGIGSPFHDDQLGLRLVEELQEERFSPGIPGVEFKFMTFDRPGWGLLEILQPLDKAILVDSMLSGRRPGSIRRLDPLEIPLPPRFLTSHEVGLAAVLSMGHHLGLLPRWMILYGVEMTPCLPAFSINKRSAPRGTTERLRQAIKRDVRSHVEDRCDSKEKSTMIGKGSH